MKEATAVKAHMEEHAADLEEHAADVEERAADVEERVAEVHMEERAVDVRQRSTWRSVCEGSTRGGGTHGGACAAEAHVVKAQVVELCCGCHAGMFLPQASIQVSMAAFVPIPVSLISGVACPCPASLPNTPKSVHLSTFSETCLDEAK